MIKNAPKILKFKIFLIQIKSKNRGIRSRPSKIRFKTKNSIVFPLWIWYNQNDNGCADHYHLNIGYLEIRMTITKTIKFSIANMIPNHNAYLKACILWFLGTYLIPLTSSLKRLENIIFTSFNGKKRGIGLSVLSHLQEC